MLTGAAVSFHTFDGEHGLLLRLRLLGLTLPITKECCEKKSVKIDRHSLSDEGANGVKRRKTRGGGHVEAVQHLVCSQLLSLPSLSVSTTLI